MSLKPLAVLSLLAAVSLPAQTPLTPGQTVIGTLREGDAQTDGRYQDTYVIRGRPGERVLVRMHSEEIDPFLMSGRQRGDEWAPETLNDNAGASSDARVIAYLGDDGMVEVRATSTPAPAAERAGRYTLSVTRLGEPSIASIRPGQAVRGRLETTDHEDVTGFEDHYRIQGTPGDTIIIILESTDFNPVVALGGKSDGVVQFDAYSDDSGPGTSAALIAQIAGPEPYLMVHARVPGATGSYTLLMARGEDAVSLDGDSGNEPAWLADSVLVTADSAVATDTVFTVLVDTAWTEADSLFTDSAAVPYMPLTVGAGERVNGVLGEGTRDEDGRWFEHFIYSARAGERLRISLTSDDVDPRVAVGTGTSCDFDALAADDNRGRERHARLEWTAPESGAYVIRVTTAVPGATGSFVLRVESIP
jgi:hypothetical protein